MIILKGTLRQVSAFPLHWKELIILKLYVDLKLGISEKSIFHEFHPDAEDLFNVTCDLKLVCEKLKDHTQRQKKQVVWRSSHVYIINELISLLQFWVFKIY